MSRPQGTATVEATCSVAWGAAQIVRFVVSEPGESFLLSEGSYRIDMSLTPRPSGVRARYPRSARGRAYTSLGRVFVVPPGQGLEVRRIPSASTSIVCSFDACKLADWADQELEWCDDARLAALALDDRYLRAPLQRLADELEAPGFAHAAMIELLVSQAAIELSRAHEALRRRPVSSALTTQRLRKIDERLAQSGPSPSVSELAALCNVSPRHLVRAFRASRGCTVTDYIAQTRVEQAKRRLSQNENIKSVARSLGFRSASSFTYAFRRITGQTPSQFRATLGKHAHQLGT